MSITHFQNKMALTNKVSRERIGIEVNSVLMRDSAFTGL